MCGRVARAYVHQCFEAVVNINKAVGARPSGRPRLSGGEEREIVLCTLDRAFNPASEAAAPKLPGTCGHDFCTQNQAAAPCREILRTPRPQKHHLASVCAVPQAASPRLLLVAHILYLYNSHLHIYFPTGTIHPNLRARETDSIQIISYTNKQTNKPLHQVGR